MRDHEITIFNRPTDVKGTRPISAGYIQKKLFDGISNNCLNFTGTFPMFPICFIIKIIPCIE